MPAPATEPLGVLARAQDSFGVSPNAPTNEWPFNLLSQKAVRFAGGRIGRAGDAIPAADPAEQKRCDTISAEAAAVGMKLPGRPKAALFDPFRLPALPGEPAATEITPELIRERFGGTLHPWATIEITSLADADSYQLASTLFDDYPADRTGKSAGAQVRKWFKARKDLLGAGWQVEVAGRGANGSQAVRLAVGLTKAGSVVGFAAVGLVSGLTRTMTPAKLYPKLVEFELDDFKQWLDGGTGRAVARVILRAFPPAMMEAWDDGTWADGVRRAAEKMREKLRPAYWRGEFHKLTPERALELPPAWEGVHRCVTGGRWDSHWAGDPGPYHNRSEFGEFERGDDAFYLYDAAAVQTCADGLAAHPEAWLKGKYADLRATDYAPHLSEADWKAVAKVYRQTAEFYADAAAKGLAVVSEITTRTDAEIAAETAPAKKPKAKGKKGACEADETMLAPLLPCMENSPYCDLSSKLVRYSCGRIGRPGKEVAHKHPKGEVERCRELAAEAERLLTAHQPDHDQGGPYLGFYAAANTGDEVPAAFTEEFVRKVLFNGTVNREVGIEVAPLSSGVGGQAEFVDWFTAVPGLHGHAFVSIGVDEDSGGACHPRLAVAFTENGSVVGVCGYVVWA